MTNYPDCPYCGNSNTALSVVAVEIDGFKLKGIQCNNPSCQRYLGFFQDCSDELFKLKEKINDLEGRIDDIEK